MTRSFLILSYLYAPRLSPRAFRWRALAERWASLGHQVDVITAWGPDLPREEVLSGVHIYRVQHPLMNRLEHTGSTPQGEQAGPTSRSRLVGLALSLWRGLYWPDAGFLWRGPAIRRGRDLLRQQSYDALISVSPFFRAHLVGARLAALSPSSRWVMDFGDPFSFQEVEPHNNLALYRGLNRRVEGRLFHRADGISVTTPETRAIYARLFPESVEKITVIPPLLTLPDPGKAAERSRQPEEIRLVFAGALYPNTRRPDTLLRLLAGLGEVPALRERLTLHFYGEWGAVADSFQPYGELIRRGRIVLHGPVSREEVSAALEAADVLVNIGNQTPYQLPSKVIEYAASGKPVLNLTRIAEDSSARVYASYPAALTLYEGDSSNLEQLKAWLLDLPPRPDRDFLDQWLAPYRLDAVGAAYDKLTETC